VCRASGVCGCMPRQGVRDGMRWELGALQSWTMCKRQSLHAHVAYGADLLPLLCHRPDQHLARRQLGHMGLSLS
jgi:hypothetical protein